MINFQHKRGAQLSVVGPKHSSSKKYHKQFRSNFNIQVLQEDRTQIIKEKKVQEQEQPLPNLIKNTQHHDYFGNGAQASTINSIEYLENQENSASVTQKPQQNVHIENNDTSQDSQQIYNSKEQNVIQKQWLHLQRWAQLFKKFEKKNGQLLDITKPLVFTGGGSFGTALGSVLARNRPDIEVIILVRDKSVADSINNTHRHSKYLQEYELPKNLRASTDIKANIQNCQCLIHSLPVQVSRQYFQRIKQYLPQDVPIVSVSKGLEISTGESMHQIIQDELGKDRKSVFLSGPSFAKEVIQQMPTAVVAASEDLELAKQVQGMFASSSLRVNVTSDVVGVEVCGALKNVLAIAAGIVEGLGLGHNALAAVVAQGSNEIRWLCQRMGARADTVASLAGLGDIMLTCYVNLSRNRSLGVKLGQGQSLNEILQQSTQVAEGVATAGSVITLARRYKVQLPILTCVVKILNNDITPMQAVDLMMSLPQIEEQVSAPIPSSLKYRWLLQELDTLEFNQQQPVDSTEKSNPE